MTFIYVLQYIVHVMFSLKTAHERDGIYYFVVFKRYIKHAHRYAFIVFPL